MRGGVKGRGWGVRVTGEIPRYFNVTYPITH